MATLWTVDANGVLSPHRVRLGISDGQKTQITSRDLQQGASIVIGTTQPGSSTAAASATTANPLQPQRQTGGGGPRGAF
jgi:hypothetical protein